MAQNLIRAVADLFEELDADGDGFVTWIDFFTYYSQSDFEADDNVPLPKAPTVFNHIQQNSLASSGRTGRIDVQNCGEFSDVPGGRFINLHIIEDKYYLVTDSGVYQTDSSMSFPKTLFEPSLRHLVGDQRAPKLGEARQREQREKEAMTELQIMGVQNIGKLGDFRKNEEVSQQNSNFNLKALAKDQAACSRIVASVLLDPLPFIVVATEFPVFYILQVSSQFGFTHPFQLRAPCTCLFWDYISSHLFVAHDNGIISKFQVKKMKQNTQDNIILELSKHGTDFVVLNRLLQQKSADDLTLKDLCQIYPDMQAMLVADHITDLDASKQRAYDEKISILRKMKAHDIEVVQLLTQKIFDPSKSTAETHDIDINQVIHQDPAAYMESRINWYDAQTQAKERKHGGVIINLDVKEVKRSFVIESPIRSLVGGRGLWEMEYDENILRLVIAGAQGTISIIDQDLQTIAAFPGLHEEGVTAVHCINDNIVSIGYDRCLLINSEAVQKAHEGYSIFQQRQGDVPDLDDMNDQVLQIKDLSVKQLFQGDLSAASHLIKEIQPPRPGTPIQFSFMMGNIIGVVDHDSNLTMFHAISGAHLTRSHVSFSNLLSSIFGNVSYNFKLDVGYLTLGKYIYQIKAIPNETVIEDNETWKIMKEQQQFLEQPQDNIKEIFSKKMEKLPLGSISKNVNGIIFNEVLGEVAVITNSLEITFFDMKSGQPIRIFDITSIEKELLQEEKKQTEYTSIESNDQQQFFVNGKRKQGVPQVLNKIQEADSIMNYFGSQLLSMQLDSKNRILFLVGDKGIITVYWKTGLPFDNSQVGIVGKQLDMQESVISNPFNEKAFSMKQQLPPHLRVQNDISVSGMNIYSLMIDFDKLIKDKQLIGTQRTQICLHSSVKKLLFLNDSAFPSDLFIIATTPSIEFLVQPMNSRIHTKVQLQGDSDINQFDALYQCRLAFKEKIQKNRYILGLEENQLKYENLRYFLPEFLRNLSTHNHKYPSNMPISRVGELIQSLSGCLDSSKRVVTCFTHSDTLGLLAIGYNDGIIQLVDISSTLFARHLIIKQPASFSIPSVTALCFLGEYSLLVSANSDGFVFVHSIRALKPNGQLLLSFQHANYIPYYRPIFVDFNSYYQNLSKFVDFVLLPRLMPTQEYVMQQFGYDDVIQYIIAKFYPELLGTVFFEQEAFSVRLTFYLQKYKEFIETTNLYLSKTSDVKSDLSKHMDKKSQNFKVYSMNHSYVQTPVKQHFDDSKDNKEVLVKSVFELFSEEEKMTMIDLTPIFIDFGLKIRQLFSRQPTENSSSKSSVSASSSLQQQKQQKVINKIRSSISVISIMKNFVLNMVQDPQQLKITSIAQEKQVIAADEQFFNPQVNYKKEKVIDISEKTKKAIRDLSKSRYIRKDKSEKLDTDVDNVIPLTDEQRNIIYKIVQNRDGFKTKIPIRIESLSCLRSSCAPSSIVFDQSTNNLFIGDEMGFITSYDISQFIQQSNVQPTKTQMKTIKVPGSEDIQVSAGFIEQSINQKLDVLIGKSVPIFNGGVKVIYVFRAHEMAVIDLKLQIGGQTIISFGEDKRLFCWQKETGILQGMFQRVQLDSPMDGWDKLFGTPISQLPNYPYNPKFHDVPCQCRQEAPPPASYPWKFVPSDIMLQAKSFQRSHIICSTGVSTNSDNVLDKVTDLQRQKQTIPLKKENLADVMLMSTGVTPERLNKYSNSWTMRAKLLKCTNNQLDIKGMSSTQIMDKFRTRSISCGQKKVEDMDASLMPQQIDKFVEDKFKKNQEQ